MLSLAAGLSVSWCDHRQQTGSDVGLEPAARVIRHRSRPVLFPVVPDVIVSTRNVHSQQGERLQPLRDKILGRPQWTKVRIFVALCACFTFGRMVLAPLLASTQPGVSGSLRDTRRASRWILVTSSNGEYGKSGRPVFRYGLDHFESFRPCSRRVCGRPEIASQARVSEPQFACTIAHSFSFLVHAVESELRVRRADATSI